MHRAGWKNSGIPAFSRRRKHCRSRAPTGQQTAMGFERDGARAAIRSATRAILPDADNVKTLLSKNGFEEI